MFDQTIHGGKVPDSDSDSDDTTSDDEETDAVPPMSIASKPNPSSMLSPGSGMVPPTPTPAQGSLVQNRPAQSMMVFVDENAVPRSAAKPAKFNIFNETPAQTPLAVRPVSDTKPKPFGVFQESSEQEPTPGRPRISSNPFATPAVEDDRHARPIVSEAIQEETEDDSPQHVDDDEHVSEGVNEELESPVDEFEEPIEEQLARGGRPYPPPAQSTGMGDAKKTRLSAISERTMEYTHMTDMRASTSIHPSRRISTASSMAGDEAFVASDVPSSGLSSRRSLNVVTEEEERSMSHRGRVSDASSSSSPRQANHSGSVGSGFNLPEGFTIHGQQANTTTTPHTLVVTDGYETMHTAREGISADTTDFVTANQQSDLPNPCNPSDQEVLAVLFANMNPLLSSLRGYVHQSRSSSHRMDSLNRFAKNKVRRNSSSANASRSSLAPEECFAMDLGGKPYEVLDKIGEGGFGAVFLAADVDARDEHDEADSDNEDEQSDCLVAIKAERPAALWEAVVLDRIHRRLDVSAAPSVIRPRAAYAFADESFLVLDYAAQGTLLDAVNKATTMGISPAVAGGPSAFDELLAVFFTVELLRTVEDLHEAEFIHGDLKIDNCLVRLTEVPNAEWSAQYARTGANGWSDKGIKLIDFGRAIDLSLFPAGRAQQFVSDWETDERDCVEMREGREWSYQTDYSGLASVCYCMLFGKYITTEKDPSGRYKIATPLKRVSAVSSGGGGADGHGRSTGKQTSGTRFSTPSSTRLLSDLMGIYPLRPNCQLCATALRIGSRRTAKRAVKV